MISKFCIINKFPRGLSQMKKVTKEYLKITKLKINNFSE